MKIRVVPKIENETRCQLSDFNAEKTTIKVKPMIAANAAAPCEMALMGSLNIFLQMHMASWSSGFDEIWQEDFSDLRFFYVMKTSILIDKNGHLSYGLKMILHFRADNPIKMRISLTVLTPYRLTKEYE